MKIIILGNGGHSKVIQDMIHTNKDYEITAILDDKYEAAKEEDRIIYAPFLYLNKLMTKDTKVVIAIGHNAMRKFLFKKLFIKEEQYVTVVHPSAVVSPTAKIGFGTVVMPGAYINANAAVGGHCIINTGAIVEHDNLVDDFSHISPNATLAGNVAIGEGVHIGSSATVIPGMEVGSWSTIGAGSTVIKEIPPFCTAVGSPTRIVSKGNKNMEIRM